MPFDMMVNSNVISQIVNYLCYKCNNINDLVLFVAENIPLISNTEDRIKLLCSYRIAYDLMVNYYKR